MDRQAWNDRYAQHDLVWSSEPNEFVKMHVADLDPGRALDLGCGEGRNAIWLAQKRWAVVATDFSDVAIEKAIASSHHRGITVDFRVEDATEVAAHEGHYDLIVMAYLHVDAAAFDDILRRAVQKLAPKATLFVVGHHIDNPDRGHGGPPDRRVLQDPETIAAHLTDLHIVAAQEVTRTVHVDGGEATAIDALVIATAP